jgi:predicted PurR-regulated permease PerM
MGVGIFVIVFAFPLAIYGTSVFSNQVTAEVSDQVRKGLEEHNKLFSNKIDPDNLKDSARDALELFRSKIKDISHHVELMHTYVYQYAATLFLEIIAIPLLLLGILYLGARLVAKGRMNLHIHSSQYVGSVKTETQ